MSSGTPQRVRSPQWVAPATALGLRYGQEYGVPLSIGVGEETTEGYLGDKADTWFPAKDSLNTGKP